MPLRFTFVTLSVGAQCRSELKLYEQVALRRDVPDEGLKAGDVATLVDSCARDPRGDLLLVLEVINAMGQTVCVTSVSVYDVQPLRADEVLPCAGSRVSG